MMTTTREILIYKAKKEARKFDRKTQENKLRSITLMIDVLESAGFNNWSQLSDVPEHKEEDVLDIVEEAIKNAIKAGHFGQTKSTIEKRLGNAYRTMKVAGMNQYMIESLRVQQSKFIASAGISLTQVKYVPTMSDVQEIFTVLSKMKDGSIELFYRGTKMNPSMMMQARLYALIGISYQVRASTQRVIEWEHITSKNFNLWNIKHRGIDLEALPRFMYDEVWDVLQEWKEMSGNSTGSIWTNKGDVPKWAGEIIKATTIPSRANGAKIGFHAFRASFATWAHNNDVPVDVIANTLGHSSSVVTEKYYIGKNAKQQKAMKANKAFVDAMVGFSKRVSTIGKTMKTWSDLFKKTISWSQKSTDYFLQDEQKDTLKFLLDCGVNPSHSAVYTIDSRDSLSRIRTEIREDWESLTATIQPAIDDALLEIDSGSAEQARIILEALKEAFQ